MKTKQSFSREEVDHLVTLFFGVKLPIKADELKKQFRISVKTLHQVSGSDTSELYKEKFIQMKSLYDYLCDTNPSWAFVNGSNALKTDEGFPLSDFGLGLGPNKNGRDCEQCFGKGYTQYESTGVQRCTSCLMGFTYNEQCLRCRGTGKFGVKGKGLIECSSCKGIGSRQSFYPKICRVCHGRGVKEVKVGTVYHGCSNCKGTGEIEIFNPVIVKGRLTV